MHKEQIEHISIALETTAFFLVTLDLYGKDRLLRLTLRINQIKINKKQKRSFNFMIKLIVLGGISSFLVSNYYLFLFVISLKFQLVYKILIGLAGVVITAFIIELLMALSLNTRLGLPLALISNIFYALLKFINFISAQFKVEGVMLIIGSILFVLSKILAFYSVDMVS